MAEGTLRSFLVLSGLFLSALWVSHGEARAEATCASAECHASLLKHKTVHPPTESCDSCHESVATPHPQTGKKTFKLTQDPPELCATCHEPFGKKKVVHPPVKEGMCTTCHDPHASEQPKLLAQPLKDLCTGCHPSNPDYKFVHGPVSAGDCTACHTPHESDAKSLLVKQGEELCLGCHKTVLTKSMTTLHPPVAEGKCTECHAPHGSPFAGLLVKEFPPEPYAPYTDTEFALCFGCHKRDMVQDPDTSVATNFRDGERNLHYLHVNNKQKGRSCVLCHNVHGGANPVLIADSVPFGKWNLPLKFVKTETGGGCSPGCHKPQFYDRKVPGRKPESAKSQPPKPASPRQNPPK